MAEKKFVYLSDASLKKVLDWCDANEDDPLSRAYVGACMAVVEFDASAISDRLKVSWPESHSPLSKNYGRWYDAASNEFGFMHRDSLGRVILEMLKRERVKP